MPITPYTPLVPGATMFWGDIESNNDIIRDYINAVSLGAVDDLSIPREALVRPVTLGFPEYGMFSGFQTLRGREVHGGRAYDRSGWGSLPDRHTIIVDSADMAALRKHITPIGMQGWCPAGSSQVTVDLTAWHVYDGTSGVSNLEAGYIELVHYDRVQNTRLVQAESRRSIYAVPAVQRISMMAVFDIGQPGDHAWYLQFVRSQAIAANNTHIQIDLADITATWETR